LVVVAVVAAAAVALLLLEIAVVAEVGCEVCRVLCSC
jgi:hypothetical protein